MTEFVLNNPAKRQHPFYALDEFAKGYVEAMFFTNGDTGDERENLLNELGVERLTRRSVENIRDTCNAFLSTIMPDGYSVRRYIDELAEEPPRYGDGVDTDTRAGHMFWYARQGHGVTWTDDYSPTETGYALADRLQDASREFGEHTVQVWRGWIHT